MIIYNTKKEIREALAKCRAAGDQTGAVPTMGALHEGHLSLIETAKALTDRVVATIFVNPLQFGPNEDFDTYPRSVESDLARLEASGCDLVFMPDRAELFPPDFSTKISVAGVGEDHCAISRPQFFDGVATIVTKLLLVLSPDVAVFGEKDYQQLAVIRRLVRDLDIPTSIVGVPTVRQADGLAMSSRNQYLAAAERDAAPALFVTLTRAAEKLQLGHDWSIVQGWATARLIDAGFSSVDYINYVDASSLAHIDRANRPGRILAAAWIGKTRLIDNVPVKET